MGKLSQDTMYITRIGKQKIKLVSQMEISWKEIFLQYEMQS